MSVTGQQDRITPNGHLEDRTVHTSEEASAELSAVVDQLLNDLTDKFKRLSDEVFAKMDEMSRRLDNLEASIQTNEKFGH